jgi:hypothetical protein
MLMDELAAAEAKYQAALTAWHRAQKRLSEAKRARDAALAKVPRKPYVPGTIASQSAQAWSLWVQGERNMAAIAAAVGCTERRVSSAINHRIKHAGYGPPEFWTWSKQQGWSFTVRYDYLHPGSCSRLHELLMPVELFREMLVARMAALPYEQRAWANVTLVPGTESSVR